MNQDATLWHITGVRSSMTAAALMAALAGCSSAAPQSCPNDLPASCPSPAPSFSADVQPLIQKYCTGCHSPGGAEPMPLLTSYDNITGPADQTARTIEFEVMNCKMPKAGQPQPTSEERQTILGWIICGAKND